MSHNVNLDIRNEEPLRKNYDYGEGLYMNLDKYKSVDEFRKNRRKKRKKALRQLFLNDINNFT